MPGSQRFSKQSQRSALGDDCCHVMLAHYKGQVAWFAVDLLVVSHLFGSLWDRLGRCVCS